jgi:hypothetical protein
VQDSITGAVLTTLRPWLGEQRGVAMRAPTRDITAYDRYLKASFALRRANTEPKVRDALRAFESVIAIDSSFARAHAAITQAYIKLAEYVPARDVLPPARASGVACARAGLDGR